MPSLLLRQGRIIDPANSRDSSGDLAIVDGRIAAAIPDGQPFEEIDCRGLVIAPGLIDLHVHFREPGPIRQGNHRHRRAGSRRRRIHLRGLHAQYLSRRGQPSVVTWIREKAEREACVNVFTTGAITRAIAGEELAPIGSMARAGIVALTDDGHCVQNHELMRRALEYARMFQLPVLDHCQDYGLVGKGVMHEGYWSTLLGLPGWPSAGEEMIVMRNILLAEPLRDPHPLPASQLRHAASACIRDARARGVPISGEVCPHHIALTDESLQGFDTNFKMNPPLRARADVDALIQGIADGVVTILASDHAPHCAYEKEVEFDMAPFGIVGLETELGLFLDILVHKNKAIDLPRLIALLTIEPARLLRLDRGTLTPGAPGDVTIIDPDLEWTVDAATFQSRSANTPFHGWELKGRAVRTIVAGKTVWPAQPAT